MSNKKKLMHQIIDLEIQRLSVEGRGISELDGKKVFVFGALENEKVSAKVMKQHSRYLEAKLESVIVPSARRTEPVCIHFGECGGCQLQHLSSDDQIAHKQNQLKNLLDHAGVTPVEWHAPLIGPATGYRNKARLGARFVEKKGEMLVGFREAHSNKIVEMTSCAILHPKVGNLIETLRQFIKKLDAFRDIPQIEVAAGDHEVAFIFRVLKPVSNVDREKLLEFAQQHNITLYLQPGGPDSLEKIWSDTNQSLTYHLPLQEIQFQFEPLDFTQINPFINRLMIEQAIKWLAITPEDNILDLFCGLGNFSLPLAKYAKKVVGVEGDEQMVERASSNARNNHLLNTEFYAANLFESLENESWFNISHNKVLLDPPRLGAQALVSQIERLSPQSILYVSCDMNTFVRDAAILVQKGYELQKIGIMDMFPHTKHVETMGLFKWKGVVHGKGQR